MIFKQEVSDMLVQAEKHTFGQARGEITYGDLLMYVRIGTRLLPDRTAASCFQIARVGVYPETSQRTGLFTRALDVILHLTRKPIYVECVHNRDFGDALLRRGFVIVRDDMDGMVRDLVLHRDPLV